MKASRSRWALFILAWILNTKAEKSSLNTSTSPWSLTRGRGGVVMRRNSSRNGSTPKVVRAEPKNTGDRVPFRTASMSNSRPAPSSSTSSRRAAAFCAPIMSSSAGSSRATSAEPTFLPRSSAWKNRMRCFSRS